MGIVGADEHLQADGLGAVDDGHDDIALLVGVGALALGDGGAVAEVFHDEAAAAKFY